MIDDVPDWVREEVPAVSIPFAKLRVLFGTEYDRLQGGKMVVPFYILKLLFKLKNVLLEEVPDDRRRSADLGMTVVQHLTTESPL